MNVELLTRLLDISRQMAETHDLDRLLNYAMDVALEIVGAEYGYLVLVSKDGTLDFRVRRNNAGYTLNTDETRISHSILEKVVRSGDPVMTADAMTDPDFSHARSVAALKLRSVLCVPLVARQKIIGGVYIENRTESAIFDADDLKVLQYFATHAAVAIENALLTTDLEVRITSRTEDLEAALLHLDARWVEAVEANAVRTQLLSNVAHDIRSPLSSTLASLQMMLQGYFGDLTADQREWLEAAVQTITHVLQLTQDFFDLMKSEMGQLRIYPEPTDTGMLLGKIARIGRTMPWHDNVAFEADIADDLPILDIDPTRIEQVVYNLLANALKFTRLGSVTLYAHREADSVWVGVRDTGSGIAEADQATIFDRFTQSGDLKSRKRGTGLGLAICRELVERQGGSIHLTSTLGEGSDFHFRLPC